jgi:Tol biopolymer transport system component
MAYHSSVAGPQGGTVESVRLVSGGTDRVLFSYPEELGHGGSPQGPPAVTSFSADGRYLALFKLYMKGGASGENGPFQIRTTSGTLLYSSDTSALFPVWSGNQLYFRKGQCCGPDGDLMRWDPVTNSVTKVAPGLAWYAPSASPDGRLIAYTTSYAPSYLPHVGVFDVGAVDARRLSNDPRSNATFVSANVVWAWEESPVSEGMGPSQPSGRIFAYDLQSKSESLVTLPGALPSDQGRSWTIADLWPRS